MSEKEFHMISFSRADLNIDRKIMSVGRGPSSISNSNELTN